MEEQEEIKCGCGADSPGLHTCPFAEEIWNDTDECACCDECTYQCMLEI